MTQQLAGEKGGLEVGIDAGPFVFAQGRQAGRAEPALGHLFEQATLYHTQRPPVG